ncbi:GNAT family N-acetyltransferase [Streptomyces sp. NPDC001970]
MIRLRDLTMDDAPAVQRIYSGASVRFTRDRPYSSEEARERVAKSLELAREIPRLRWDFGIVVDDRLIGVMSLRVREPGLGALSYILREDTWGNGYATEAARRVVVFAFTIAGLARLEAKHHPDNPASGHVLAKAGFRRIGTSDLHAADGVIVPYPVYELRGFPR